ncbi:MAG TPA: T9SS type A sorting domain-containing protein, partial [Bacteroidia bacterium]|nr:T9SS type A sorting domain-containing protein [Bacteroidia bacterium]
DFAWGVAVDHSGNSFLTGNIESPSATFGTTTLTNVGGGDVFIVKYDPAGNEMWAKSSSGSYYDEGESVGTDAAGNCYVTGYFRSPTCTFGSTVLTNTNPSTTNHTMDLFLAKLDASGNILWAKSAGGLSDEEGKAIRVDDDGSCYLAGSSKSNPSAFGSFTLTGAGMFLAKFDSGGNVVWAEGSGGNDLGVGTAICFGPSGKVYSCGYFKAATATFGTHTISNVNSSTYDIFIVETDTSGNYLSAASEGDSDNDFAYGVGTDSTGNIYLSGAFRSAAIAFSPLTLTNIHNMYDDFFIAKSGSLTAVAAENAAPAIPAWPNPANGDFMITVPGNDALVTITDAGGELVYSARTAGGNQPLHLGSPGLYFVTVLSEGKSSTQKIIIR